MVELKILVQGKDGLSVDKINEFIGSCEKAKLALVYSSLRDDFACVGFFEELVKKLAVPFIGSRVLCSITQDGYFEDAIVVGVLCRDFEVDVHQTKLDLSNPDATCKEISPRLDESELCILYSSILTKEMIYLNRILAMVWEKHPNLQLVGGNSSPTPVVATKDGVFEGYLAYAVIKNVGFDFWWESGFNFVKNTPPFKVTKTDDYRVIEIDGKNAVEKYTGIQQIQPYFLNMLSNLICKMEANKLLQTLSKASDVMYRAIINVGFRGLGFKDEDNIDIFSVIQIDDEGLISATKTPEGAVLRKIETTKDEQLKLYDKLAAKTKNAKATIITSCIFRLMYLEYDKKSIQKKLKKIKRPFIENYMHGEIGNYTPHDHKKSLTHGATINALGFN